MRAVLDSSAMIAFLDGEPEGAHVAAFLVSADEEAEGVVYAHAVNLAEVFYHVRLRTSSVEAEAAIAALEAAGVEERGDMDGPFWRGVAGLVATARALPTPHGGRGTLALGDAFGIALSNRLSAEFVTKDRAEIEPIERASLVAAHFLR